MHIILRLAAGIAAATAATAAPARPGGTGSGQGGGSPGGWSNGGGHHAGPGRTTRLGIGAIRVDRGRGRHHGRSGRQDFVPYGAAGIAGPIGAIGPYGNGFFAGRGAQSRVQGDRPYYEYDRAYPYEWPSAAGGRREWDEKEARAAAAPGRCTMENGVRVCRGW